MRIGVWSAAAACAALAIAMTAPASRAQTQQAQAQKTAPAKAQKAAPSPAKSADEGSGVSRTEAQLRQRVEQLEEQVVDMQVVLGTLESLAKSAGTASSSAAFRATGNGGYSAADAARIDSMETQIRALTAQVEQLTEQVRQGGGRSQTGYAPQAGYAPPPAAPVAAAAPKSAAPAFGSTTVTQGNTDQIGRMIGADTPASAAGSAPAQRQVVAALPADGGNPRQLYDAAYAYLLQQDYNAAETSFDEFLQRYPNDALAGNAQYWLGESHFVRGNYKAAAGAFLKGYQTYATSVKAPDSLLKLAMSLDRLGQKDAACSSYTELSTRFPQAPAHVKTRADSERRRLGCA